MVVKPNKKKNEQLKKKAVSNTTISKRNGNDKPVEVKHGTPLDEIAKINPTYPMKFGMSKGVTRNMGDYQSLRVDVWLSDEVQEGETIQEAFSRIESTIDETLEDSVMSAVEEIENCD